MEPNCKLAPFQKNGVEKILGLGAAHVIKVVVHSQKVLLFCGLHLCFLFVSKLEWF